MEELDSKKHKIVELEEMRNLYIKQTDRLKYEIK